MLEHRFDVLVNDGQLCCRVTPKLLKMRRVIASVNAMTQHVSLANVELRPRKDL